MSIEKERVTISYLKEAQTYKLTHHIGKQKKVYYLKKKKVAESLRDYLLN